MTSLFIFEGLEGVGKSTVVANVSKLLDDQSVDHITVAFPHKQVGSISAGVREILLGGKQVSDPLVEFNLYMAANIDTLLSVVVPALESGKVVLCDRYFTTTYVQQIFARMQPGTHRGLAKRYLENTLDYFYRRYPALRSPLVMFLSAGKEVSIARTLARSSTGEYNHYDKSIDENYDRFTEGYELLRETSFITTHYVTVDADQAPEKVAQDAHKHIEHLLIYPVK